MNDRAREYGLDVAEKVLVAVRKAVVVVVVVVGEGGDKMWSVRRRCL